MRIVRVYIGGRVQGVGYRAWAIETAHHLMLRGWVRNRSDGSVEMFVAGPEDAVAAMIAASGRGPPAACVLGMRIDEAQDDGSTGFAARPTE